MVLNGLNIGDLVNSIKSNYKTAITVVSFTVVSFATGYMLGEKNTEQNYLDVLNNQSILAVRIDDQNNDGKHDLYFTIDDGAFIGTLESGIENGVVYWSNDGSVPETPYDSSHWE